MISTARVIAPINIRASSAASPSPDIETGPAAPALRPATPRAAQFARLAVRPGSDNAGDARFCLALGVGIIATSGVIAAAGATNDDPSSRVGAFYTASLFGVIGLSAAGKGIHCAIKAIQQRRTAAQTPTPMITPVNAGRQEIV